MRVHSTRVDQIWKKNLDFTFYFGRRSDFSRIDIKMEKTLENEHRFLGITSYKFHLFPVFSLDPISVDTDLFVNRFVIINQFIA